MQQIGENVRSRFFGGIAEQLPEPVVRLEYLQRRARRKADDPAVDVVGNVGQALVGIHLPPLTFAADIEDKRPQGGCEKQQ